MKITSKQDILDKLKSFAHEIMSDTGTRSILSQSFIAHSDNDVKGDDKNIVNLPQEILFIICQTWT